MCGFTDILLLTILSFPILCHKFQTSLIFFDSTSGCFQWKSSHSQGEGSHREASAYFYSMCLLQSLLGRDFTHILLIWYSQLTAPIFLHICLPTEVKFDDMNICEIPPLQNRYYKRVLDESTCVCLQRIMPIKSQLKSSWSLWSPTFWKSFRAGWSSSVWPAFNMKLRGKAVSISSCTVCSIVFLMQLHNFLHYAASSFLLHLLFSNFFFGAPDLCRLDILMVDWQRLWRWPAGLLLPRCDSWQIALLGHLGNKIKDFIPLCRKNQKD